MKERVGLVFDNSPKCVELILDIWNQRGCVVFADWRIPKKRIIEMLDMCGVKKCYISSSIFSKWNDEGCLDAQIQFCVVEDDSSTAGMIPESIMEKYKENYSEEEALILFSSGTTGKSKGIILSHRAITKNADAVMSYMNLEEDDVFYIVKTLAHSSTFVGELLVALRSHHRVVISPSVYSPLLALKNINKFGVTIMCVNPTLIRLYCTLYKKAKISLDSLKTIYTSGAVMSEQLLREIQETFQGVEILNVYGLTEAGPRVSAQTKGKTWKDGSVGAAIRGVELAVLDGDGNVLPDGQRGVVHVKSECMYVGYVSNVPSRESLYQGWFNTGDVGYLCDGELFITGRWDNMIIQGSHNIFPEDVEREVSKISGINECLIFGVEDEINGESMVCIYTASENMGDVISDYCIENLATYEIPKTFIRVENIPKTENGKVSRRLAQEMYLGGNLCQL